MVARGGRLLHDPLAKISRIVMVVEKDAGQLELMLPRGS